MEKVCFKNPTIVSDDRLVELVKEIPPDTLLVSSDGKAFPSHYMVLTMFSQYFRKYFNQVPFQHGMKSKCSAKLYFCLSKIFNQSFPFVYRVPFDSSNEKKVENSGSCFGALLRIQH